MNWVLIVMVAGFGDAVSFEFMQREFESRDLCNTAKMYYESNDTKLRVLSHIREDMVRTIRFDAQCFQTGYEKAKK